MYNELISIIPPILGFLFFLVCLAVFLDFAKKSKSKHYRELISDMYVVGMIKKFAEDDKIDLLKELREYNLITRKEEIKEKDLDRAVEMHLNEKIVDKTESKLDKK